MSSPEEVLGSWVIKYTDDQKQELKPWLRCDGRGKMSYIEVSVKGARHNNEDTSFGDGRLFAVFDGHGGKFASQLLRKKLAEHFYGSITQAELDSPGAIEGSPPKVVQALDAAFTKSQEDMPSEFPAAQSGSTGVACWVHGTNGGAAKVFASCLGDSKALLFDMNTGVIPEMDIKTWDQEVGTLKGPGVVSALRAETFCHNLTGALINGRDGKWASMDKDPNGVGFREFELLAKRHSFPQSRKPYNISNMPGEERWRVLDVEPTRALGHKLKREHPLHHPETQEWTVSDPKNSILMLSCDGFFSKEAFGSPDQVTRFLTDPVAYCKDPNLFQGTCLKALLERLNETHKLPDPSSVDMGTLFERIRNVVFSKLSDETWTTAYDAAFQYLRKFAQERPVPNIKTHPVKTLLAACYFAVLLVSDDNVSVLVVFLDGVQRFGGRCIDAGICP
mmetsp:Transcript_11073/g.27143  ORF Transcript_11073/g.27143 Transcript_11073/m.27143 type:complete len:448 (+) Transcript_11073:71-1414(+)